MHGQFHYLLGKKLPDAATSAIGLFVTLAIKPTMEKMTKPANILVAELMQHTIMASLWIRKKHSIYFHFADIS